MIQIVGSRQRRSRMAIRHNPTQSDTFQARRSFSCMRTYLLCNRLRVDSRIAPCSMCRIAVSPRVTEAWPRISGRKSRQKQTKIDTKQAPIPDMICCIWLCINALHPNCGVVTCVSCLFFIVSFLVASALIAKRCLGCRLKAVRFGSQHAIQPLKKHTQPLVRLHLAINLTFATLLLHNKLLSVE